MARRKTSQHKRGRRPGSSSGDTSSRNRATSLRIVGGSLRGSKIAYTGDSLTRPMKDRVREAVFNLIGPCVKDKSAVDLFAGTGALGLEAISRGARQAVMVERHFPSARLIEQNATALNVAEKRKLSPPMFSFRIESLSRISAVSGWFFVVRRMTCTSIERTICAH